MASHLSQTDNNKKNPTPPPQGARALPLFSFKIEFLCNILFKGVNLK